MNERDQLVLVLGAGASAPFGYPLGHTLIENIISGLARIPEDFQVGFSNSSSNFDFLNAPYRAIIAFAFSRPLTLLPSEFAQSIKPWKALGVELHNTSHQSIDEFARTNPRLNKVVKLLIALEIARVGYDKDSIKNNRLRVAPQLTANARANWYGKLVAHLRSTHRSADDFRNSQPLTIVTFNYDNSLEDFLEKELARAELYAGLKVEEVVSIIHVHGSLKMTQPPSSAMPLAVHFGNRLFAAAEEFLVIDDTRSDQDPAAIAGHLIERATTVVTIGFDFHTPNVKLIGLDQPKVAAKCHALNYSGSTAFDRRAIRAGVKQSMIMKGGKNFEISAAIDDGLLDR